MSKNTAHHKNYLEIKPIINGLAVDRIKVPIGEFKKVTMTTKVKGTDRVYLVSEEYSQILDKYT